MINDNSGNNFGLNFENIISSMKDDSDNNDFQNTLQKNENVKNNDFHKNILSVNLEEIEKNIVNVDKNNSINNVKNKSSVDKSVDCHSGHRQRARERFLSNPDAVNDRDLLELMLFWIIPRADVKPIVQKLLDRFKNINEIYNASVEEINDCGANGVAIKYIFQMVRAINKHILTQNIDKITINSVEKVVEYCRSLFNNLQEEEFFVIFLDNKLNVIKEKSIGIQSVNNVSLSGKELIKEALSTHSNNVILTHNHPSNDTQPSNDDISTTNNIIQILSHIDVKVIDHIIVGTTNYYSFAENGMI